MQCTCELNHCADEQHKDTSAAAWLAVVQQLIAKNREPSAIVLLQGSSHLGIPQVRYWLHDAQMISPAGPGQLPGRCTASHTSMATYFCWVLGPLKSNSLVHYQMMLAAVPYYTIVDSLELASNNCQAVHVFNRMHAAACKHVPGVCLHHQHHHLRSRLIMLSQWLRHIQVQYTSTRCAAPVQAVVDVDAAVNVSKLGFSRAFTSPKPCQGLRRDSISHQINSSWQALNDTLFWPCVAAWSTA